MKAPQVEPQTRTHGAVGNAAALRTWTRASFRSSLVPMVIADDGRHYVAANPAACLLFRLPEQELLKRSIEDVTPLENRSQVASMWEAFVREGTQRGVFELLMPDGPTVRVEYSATANIEPGRHLAIFLFPPGNRERAAPGSPAGPGAAHAAGA